MMAIRNNVTRLLDQLKIPYTAFELPPEKLGAMETAQFLGVAPELVYKSIVVSREGKGKPVLALVPGICEVDLKLLAKALGEKKLQLPTEKEAERITGLQAGGISPLALLNRGFQVVVDATAQTLPLIYISGGQRGLNIRLSPADLVRLTNAALYEISRYSLALWAFLFYNKPVCQSDGNRTPCVSALQDFGKTIPKEVVLYTHNEIIRRLLQSTYPSIYFPGGKNDVPKTIRYALCAGHPITGCSGMHHLPGHQSSSGAWPCPDR